MRKIAVMLRPPMHRHDGSNDGQQKDEEGTTSVRTA
jgi:hypothetical protein